MEDLEDWLQVMADQEPPKDDRPLSRFTHKVVVDDALSINFGKMMKEKRLEVRKVYRARIKSAFEESGLSRRAQLVPTEDGRFNVFGNEGEVDECRSAHDWITDETVTVGSSHSDEISAEMRTYCAIMSRHGQNLRIPTSTYLSSISELVSDSFLKATEDATDIVDNAKKRAFKSSPYLEKLKPEDKEMVQAAAGPRPVIGPQDDHQVDEMAADLHAGAPWLRPATTELWKQIKHNVAAGSGAHASPILLHGPPGNGKTSWARRVAEGLGVPLVEIDVGSGAAAFQVAGLEKGWGGAEPGLPVSCILSKDAANPVVLVNEVCLAGGGARSSTSVKTSLNDALLPLLDRSSAARYRCPALRVPLDMSRVTWILTANSLDTIPAALLSRVHKVEAPMPSASDVEMVVRRRLDQVDEDLADQAAQLVGKEWRSKSRMTLRQVDAMIERIKRASEAPLLN